MDQYCTDDIDKDEYKCSYELGGNGSRIPTLWCRGHATISGSRAET